MKIEIELPEDIIKKAVVNGWESSFSPHYNQQYSGTSLSVVEARIKAFVASQEFVSIVDGMIKSTAALIAEEVVRNTLRSKIKTLVTNTINKRKDEGTLL